MSSEQRPTKRDKRYSAIGSVLLSWDFLAGVPVGFVIALPALFSDEVKDELPTLLLAVAGFGAAVAALVLTGLSVLLTTITPAYRRMLAKTPHGVEGVTAPFQWVIGVSAIAVVMGFAAAMVQPMVTERWQLYLLTAVPVSLLLWAVLGCLQVSRQLIRHWRDGMRAQDAADALQSPKD